MEKQWFVAGAGSLIIVLAVVGLWYGNAKAPAPETQIQESASSASTTPPRPSQPELKSSVLPTSTPAPVVSKFPINSLDTIAAWSFKGVYTGNDTLVAKANADMEHLKSFFGKGKYDDYDLYVGIANDYDLLGDGAAAYQNYNRAVSIHPDKGLAYANLGHLMDELGAYHTAVDAYAKAVAVEPLPQYKTTQTDYLHWRFPSGTP